MDFFRDLPIKHKLTSIIMATAAAVLALSLLAFITNEVVSYRHDLRGELSTLAEIISSNSASALVFDDKEGAENILLSLSTKQNILAARIYRAEGQLLASYGLPPSIGEDAPALPDEISESLRGDLAARPEGIIEGDTVLGDRLSLYKPVFHDGHIIGTFFIQSDLRGLQSQLFMSSGIAGAILLVSLGIAFLLSMGLQRVVSNPIMELVQAMGVVSREENFAARVEVKGHDEIGRLVEEFNKMLEQIELRDARLKRGMQELHQAKETAEFASRSKTDFLSNMSHELRTPLNAIIGFTEVVIDQHFGELNETQQEYLHDSLLSSNHLLAIINDILDLSKVEAGKMELETTNVDLVAVLNGSIFMVKEKAMKHDIDVSVDAPEALETLVADERKIKQVIFNLLSNAVKFTPDGGSIVLTAETVDGGWLVRHLPVAHREKAAFLLSDSSRPFMKVSVADTGVGIKKGNFDKIFRPFQQEDNSTSRKFGGTGLGLTLCRKIISLHGGWIWVASREGEGSVFSFVVPLKPEAVVDGVLPGAEDAEKIEEQLV